MTPQLTRNEALAKLDEWASMMKDRDPRVLAARHAGLTTVEISKRMRIARSTVDDILRKHGKQADS